MSSAERAHVDIPFNDWSTERHEEGEKTATTRTSKSGEPGDTFEDNGTVYELTHVVKLPLGIVAKHFYEEEGACNPDDFVAVWEDIHPRKGFDPEWKVWLHLYREKPTEPRAVIGP